MKRKADVIEDINGKKIVVINDIYFKGRRNINWKDVEEYLRKYIGEIYEILETSDRIYIGKDFVDEYTGSKDTIRLKGAAAKAKANAAQGIPELIAVAAKKRYKENLTNKHTRNAKYGWYRYETRFALPVFDEEGDVVRYNIFTAELLIRHDLNGRLYLYDIVNVQKKKERTADR